MNTTSLRFKLFLIALFCVALPSLAQSPASLGNQELVKQGLTRVYGVPINFVLRKADPGNALSGVEIARKSDALFIDPTPCRLKQQKRIFMFVKPYKGSKISDAKCDGKSYPQIQVIQQ